MKRHKNKQNTKSSNNLRSTKQRRSNTKNNKIKQKEKSMSNKYISHKNQFDMRHIKEPAKSDSILKLNRKNIYITA